MKLLSAMACFIFLSLPFQTYAAKIDWVIIKHGGDIMLKVGDNDFSDSYSFYIPTRIGKIDQPQTYIVTIDEIKGFAALLVGSRSAKTFNKGKGNRVDRITEILIANLSSTLTNNLVIGSEGSPTVNPPRNLVVIDEPPVQVAPEPDEEIIRVVETPIPAATWLFGTALLGLIGINRQLKGR